MDATRCALIVLSAAGLDRGSLDDPVRQAEAIVGEQCEPVAQMMAERWLADGGSIIAPEDRRWPVGLADLGAGAPLLLWVRGELPDPGEQAVAIVGSRECTGYGRRVAGDLAQAVVGSGRWVVSGGALGIDEAAHSAALDSGGRTMLCAAGGAGHIYPPSHAAVFHRASRHGAVIWEYPPGVRLTRRGFLHRNRLISAIAVSTVLVEAATRSGALNTGRSAADLGRLVLGVPGPINSPVSEGVHRAIAEGWAALLLGPRDLVDLMATGSG